MLFLVFFLLPPPQILPLRSSYPDAIGWKACRLHPGFCTKTAIHPAIFLSQSQKKPDPEIFGRIFEEKHPPLSQMDKPDAFPATAQQRDHYPYYPGTTNREYILLPPIHKVGYNLQSATLHDFLFCPFFIFFDQRPCRYIMIRSIPVTTQLCQNRTRQFFPQFHAPLIK